LTGSAATSGRDQEMNSNSRAAAQTSLADTEGNPIPMIRLVDQL